MSDGMYEQEAQSLIDARIGRLRGLKFAEVAALPEAAGEETVVAGRKCALTVFVQKVFSDQLLVTVQVARRGLLGLASFHTERGLIFSREGGVREATSEELQNSGG
jgi:hypothetical protein